MLTLIKIPVLQKSVIIGTGIVRFDLGIWYFFQKTDLLIMCFYSQNMSIHYVFNILLLLFCPF
jgi:hypothetical protein